MSKYHCNTGCCKDVQNQAECTKGKAVVVENLTTTGTENKPYACLQLSKPDWWGNIPPQNSPSSDYIDILPRTPRSDQPTDFFNYHTPKITLSKLTPIEIELSILWRTECTEGLLCWYEASWSGTVYNWSASMVDPENQKFPDKWKQEDIGWAEPTDSVIWERRNSVWLTHPLQA